MVLEVHPRITVVLAMQSGAQASQANWVHSSLYDIKSISLLKGKIIVNHYSYNFIAGPNSFKTLQGWSNDTLPNTTYCFNNSLPD